ncbi:TrbC/VirB2 family protein [Oceanobacillus indicireducens]|uniref:Uncharacterized protein n=1 Tax=Oceanobacillus indicireducens TaxID=1004261 RepID=A0A917Y2Y3_9BACI|nr:TrbC/VirB2 family protein [Oceanobacillus indicireducens]GGN65569.1 hypothetical protein GCM10007971_34530 [Oceanobacillus indicireducens]
MKTKTYDFKSFIRKEHESNIKAPTISLIPLAIAPFIPTQAFAETADIQNKMMTAFDPLLQLIQGAAYPIALAVVLGGGIFIILGNSDRGFSMITKASMGYVLISVLPMIFGVLADVMAGVV